MKQELFDLYKAALACDDQSAIAQYQEAKKRIAPAIVMDLILDEIEREKLLEEMAGVLEKTAKIIAGSANAHQAALHIARAMCDEALQKYWER